MQKIAAFRFFAEPSVIARKAADFTENARANEIMNSFGS